MGNNIKKLFSFDPTRVTLLTVLVGVTIIVSIVLVTLLAYWTFYPYQTVTYPDVPFKLDKQTYKQGETAHYYVSYCKSIDIVPKVHRYFIDGLKIEAAEHDVKFIKGCHDNQEISFTIPESLPPGRWHLSAVATYKFNPIREEVTNSHNTEWFNVVRSDDGSYGDGTVINGRVVDD